jgi:hypothetical protein
MELYTLQTWAIHEVQVLEIGQAFREVGLKVFWEITKRKHFK